LLGVQPFEADLDVISSAATARWRTCDVFKRAAQEQSQQLLNELSAARVCLLQPEKKAHYDPACGEAEREEETGGSAATAPPIPRACGSLSSPPSRAKARR